MPRSRGYTRGRVRPAAPSPEVLEKKCYRKMRHVDEMGATTHLAELRAKPGGYDTSRLVVYPCEICHGWHVGHKKKREMQGGLIG